MSSLASDNPAGSQEDPQPPTAPHPDACLPTKGDLGLRLQGRCPVCRAFQPLRLGVLPHRVVQHDARRPGVLGELSLRRCGGSGAYPVADSVAEGTIEILLNARRDVERLEGEAARLAARLAETRARLARVEAWAAAHGAGSSGS